MAISRLFSKLDYIWASHGVSCLPHKSALMRRVLGVIRMSTHIFLVQHLIGNLTNVITTGDLRNIFSTLYVSCCYMMYFVIAYKLEDTAMQIVNFADGFLTVKVKRRLIKIELYAVLCYIVWFAFYVGNGITNQALSVTSGDNKTDNFDRINYWISRPKESVILSVFYCVTFTSLLVHFTDAMIVGAVFVYCYQAYVIYTIQGSFLDYVSKKKTTIKEFRIIWTEIISIKDALEHNLNTIPLLAMEILFQNAVGLVVVFSGAGSEEVETGITRLCRLIIYWGFEVGIAIPILMMPFLVSWINNSASDRFKTLQKKLICEGIEQDFELGLLVAEISSNVELNLTGYGMFKVDKGLILAFFSSVITFSVLFMQLSNS